MSVQPVRLYIEPILNKPVELITDFTGLDNIAGDMIETMLEYRGIGLAANQIGLNKNLAALYLEDKTKILVVANLIITGYSKEVDTLTEGCLSAPGISINMKRPTWVEFEYNNLIGEKKNMRLEGFDCRIFFHEWCHLQGQLITDSIAKL